MSLNRFLSFNSHIALNSTKQITPNACYTSVFTIQKFIWFGFIYAVRCVDDGKRLKALEQTFLKN